VDKDTALQEAALSKAAFPELALQEMTPQEAALSEAALPEAALPEAALPELALQEMTPQEAALPEAALPEAALPEAALPEAALPEAALSEAALSEAALPEAALSEVALVEAVLYMETSPVTVEAVVKITGLSEMTVSLALSEIGARYKAESSGIELLETVAGFLFSPKQEYWDILREHYGKKNQIKLSKAAIETLTIIAYMQPVTRAEVEQIRGVSADNMIRLLQERNLIRETGKKDAPGKPVQYGTTNEFLDVFHLASIADLPRLDEQDAEKFELEQD
jgi:segregation and condensation protein B